MDNSIFINFSNLPYAEFDFKILNIVAQYWDADRGWSEFIIKPRYSSALLMVVSEITVKYTNSLGDSFTATNGDVIYCPYGSRYEFSIISPYDPDIYNQIKSICINFNLISHDKQIISLSEKPIKVVNFKNNQLKKDFFEIYQARTMPMIRKYKLYKIMKTIVDIFSNESKSNYLIKEAIQYIEDHYAENFKIAFLAQQFNLSESHFRKLFKYLTNLSPTEYRNKLRIEHAKEFLSQNNLSVSEVAQAVGIEDQFYFSRIFKKYSGISPIKYKNE